MMAKTLTDFSVAAILDWNTTDEDEDMHNETEPTEERKEKLKEEDADKKKKTRTVFTRQQIQRLESAFDRKKYFTNAERQKLATDLILSETQVKIWLQNRRNKWKKHISNHDSAKHIQTYHSLIPPDIASSIQAKSRHYSLITRNEYPYYTSQTKHIL